MVLRRASCVAMLLIAPIACRAAEPQLIGSVDLGQRVAELQVTPDGRLAVAQMQASNGQLAGLRIVDTSTPDKPQPRGFVPTERNGNMSLSADGRRLLLLLAPERLEYDKLGDHLIMAFDLADPDHPTEAWRQNVSALKVVLAPDASGYVASLPFAGAAKPGQSPARFEVHWADGRRPGTMVEDDAGRWATPMLSPDGDFLLVWGLSGDLRVFDLRPDTPVLDQQSNRGFSALSLYECPRLLNGGTLLVQSGIWPRLEVFAVREGLPRIAVLPIERDIDCADVPGSSDSVVYLTDQDGRLTELNMAKPESPGGGRVWSLPETVRPARVDKADHLFAAQGNGGDHLAVYDLHSMVGVQVDWSALWAAHQDALRAYGDQKDSLRERHAVDILIHAGVRRALEAPVEGITPQRAAAVLNDYGFLLAKPWLAQDKIGRRGEPGAQKYLRRAIEIDPTRAIAYLNLADLLRDELGGIDSWTEKRAKQADIEDLYRQYLKRGGAPTARIDGFLRGDPGEGHPDDICQAIADYSNAGRLDELISYRPTAVAIGNGKVDLIFTDQGTAHVPDVAAVDAATGELLGNDSVPIPDGEDLWGGDRLGLVVYHGVSHVLHFKDMQHPVSTFLLSGAKACRFLQATRQQIGPGAIEPELCRQLDGGRGPISLDFDKPVAMAPEEAQSRYWAAGPAGMRLLDVLNDGDPVNVVELQLASGAGAGCDETFYDTADETGKHYTSGAARELLMALQHADPTDRYPIRPCGNAPRFFRYQDKTYLETKPASWPPGSEQDTYHRVTRVDGGKVVDVCDFQFTSSVSPIAARR